MSKTTITSNQLFSLTVNATLGGAIILISSVLAKIAQQDAWITGILTPFFGLLLIWIICFLGSQHPGKTYVGIINIVFGKWLGLIVSLGFVFFCLQTSYHVAWYMGNFITTTTFPEMSPYAINSLLIISAVIALLYGIEVIARFSEISAFLISVIFLASMLFVLPNAKIDNLQPLLEKGIAPILKSSFFLLGISTFPLVTLLMVYPINIDNISMAKKSILKGYLWAGFITFIAILFPILVLGGAITANHPYATYLLVKQIDFGWLAGRFEFSISFIWTISEFLALVIFFYAGIIGLSELLGIKDYKNIVIPFGLVLIVMSGIAFTNAAEQGTWSVMVYQPYVTTYGFILPVSLLVVFFIKKWIFKPKCT